MLECENFSKTDCAAKENKLVCVRKIILRYHSKSNLAILPSH